MYAGVTDRNTAESQTKAYAGVTESKDRNTPESQAKPYAGFTGNLRKILLLFSF